jgi:lambda repressor-like predicted transcriptional regulator
METTELTAAKLKERMEVKGVSVSRLARESGLYQSDLSAILLGKEYCGEKRRRRIELAIIRLELDKEPEPKPKPEPEEEDRRPVVFRITQL